MLVLGAATGIGLVGATGLGVATAAVNNNEPNGLGDKFVSKSDLDNKEVKADFDEHKAKHREAMRRKFETRLQKAVDQGDLTEEQKAKIEAKLEELRAGREDWLDKTPEQRHEAKKNLQAELRKWAEDNGIPLGYLHRAPALRTPEIHANQ